MTFCATEVVTGSLACGMDSADKRYDFKMPAIKKKKKDVYITIKVLKSSSAIYKELITAMDLHFALFLAMTDLPGRMFIIFYSSVIRLFLAVWCSDW